jgi:type I restriction enzyme S subunit
MKKGWPIKTLGDVCQLISGQHIDAKDYNTESRGVGYLTGPSDFGPLHPVITKWTEHPKVKAKRGDVLITVKGSGVGKINLLDEDEVAISRQLMAVRVTGAEPSFVHAILSSTFDHFQSLSTGAAIPGISREQVLGLTIALPPLAEQQRIVGLLDEAFEGLATAKANAEKNLQNARALFESHLQSVFTQRGPGWVETTLGEIGKISMCKRIFKEETTATGDIPFYKIGTFGKDPDAFIPSQTYNEYRAKYSFPDKGAVLISAAGTIGRRVRYDGEPAYFQDSNIVWIENDEKQALNDYLYHFYGACDWNSTKGATIPRLYNDNLRRIAIGFPKSLPEQRRIVTQLDALSEETQRLARLYERKLAALEALKKSLLHQAFTGEL